ncbi:MAG: caspase family protein [Clostridia bacterium]|nr:caspase family protein [Clostridia bacterium]
MKKALAALTVLTLLFGSAGAAADTLLLPPELTVLEEEAFLGDTSVTDVSLPSGLTAIGDRAFSGCTQLRTVEIPVSVTDFGEDAFLGATPALLIRTVPGSPAVSYARLRGYDYQADTHYRALGVYCEYSTSRPLAGTAADVAHLVSGLATMDTTAWTVTSAANLSGASALQSAIGGAFSGATENDVSLFYFSGHGIVDDDGRSCLMLNDAFLVTASALRGMLDTVPGRKVVLLDCCFSGGMLDDVETYDAAEPGSTWEEEREPAPSPADFLSGLIAPFALRSRAALNADGYYVLTACSSTEESWGDDSGGCFTTALLQGIGYSTRTGRTADVPADVNADGAVSLDEAFSYASVEANRLIDEKTPASRIPVHQTAQCYPAGCTRFAPFRR